MTFETIEQELKPILENHEEARADDMCLYLLYVGIKRVELYTAFSDREYRLTHGIASYESVGRIRRKLQAKYRELRPAPEYLAERKRAEKEYKKYARGRGAL